MKFGVAWRNTMYHSYNSESVPLAQTPSTTITNNHCSLFVLGLLLWSTARPSSIRLTPQISSTTARPLILIARHFRYRTATHRKVSVKLITCSTHHWPFVSHRRVTTKQALKWRRPAPDSNSKSLKQRQHQSSVWDSNLDFMNSKWRSDIS